MRVRSQRSTHVCSTERVREVSVKLLMRRRLQRIDQLQCGEPPEIFVRGAQRRSLLEGYGSETELLVCSPGADPQSGVRIPVSRDRAQAVRETLLSSTMGVRVR